MEAAVVHLDRPAAMPSQSQMSYRGSSGLHGRQSQSQAAEVCYKSGSSVGGSGVGVSGVVSGSSSSTVSSASQRGHSPATYSGSANANYAPMRYIHPSYTPSPGVTAVSTYRDYHRENTSRSSAIVGDRQNVDYLPGQVKPRISLLSSSEYLALSRNRQLQNDNYRDSLGPSNLPPLEVNPIPVKKIRLGDPKDSQRNLRIDTRDDGQQAAAYTPKVEAISPTLPSEAQQDDANFRSTKDDLLHGISKVDREIIDTELQISKLKRKLQDLEEAAKQPTIKTEEEEIPQPTHQSPAQKIYAENRRKAQEAHMLLKNLGPKIELPLYNQPSDTTVYHENKRRHLIFKKRLLINLRKKHIERENRQKRLTATYSEMVQDWLRKVEKVENSQKRKAKDAKNREFFEKIFPKLRKQREDRERFNRVGARVKSEADLEEIMDGLQEQELEDKKMRSYAVVPPMLLDAKQRSIFYINNNGKLDDFATEYKERQLLNIWTQAEKDIFKEKFLQHPKNFGAIASYLDKKSVCDCVQYYYLSKKTENYKRLLRKHRVATRSRRNPQSKVNSGNVNSSSLDILATATGVTTRLQREQLQKQEPPQNSTAASQSHCDITDFMLTPQTHSINPQSPQLLPLDKKHEKEKSDVKDSKKKKEDEETTDDDLSDPINNQIVNKSENADAMENSVPLSGVDSENTQNTVACIVCKTESNCTRALPRYQASQYSLKEEDIPADARVCNLCRCKAVRSRFTNCPIPTCPNSKGFKVKRLRPLPCKWADLPAQVKDPIVAEFQIDDSVTKCCSACYNRIVRRIGVHNDPSSSTETAVAGPPSPSNPWTEKEITNLKSGLLLHGTRWHEVAGVVKTRTHSQCMKFFFQRKKSLGLDQYLPPDMKDLVDERKPVLTDEEESGSSTSSCDEMDAVPANDSDTASAPSPVHPPGPLIEDENKVRCDGTPPPQLIQEGRVSVGNDLNDRLNASSSPHGKMPGPGTPSLPPVLVPNREDYDSSATETADEGQGGGESESGANRGPTPKREEEPSSPLTVKDLMLGVIEMQLMKNQGQGQSANTPGGPPTISSILKTDHTVGYIPREKSRQIDNSLATVSVVNTHHTHQPIQEVAKESLVVVQVQPGMRGEQRESEGVTLDLSIKKPRNEGSSQSGSKNIIQHHISSNTPVQSPHSVFRSSQSSGDQPTYFHQVLAPPLTPKLSPGIISSSGNTVTTKSQCGSIMHGTPVSSPNIYSQSRYEPSQTSLIHHTSPHKETGTPVHQRSTLYPPQSSEYFHKRMPSYYPTRPSAYNVELEQRQIIMNDYITSQQMHASGSSSGPRNGREKMFYQPTSRQGVIQRHNTKPPSPSTSHYPPGHEAFSSLVDVAVRQPSLPVPPHSGMSQMSEIKNMQEEKRHLHEGLGERFNRESPHERYSNREPDNRYIKENNKIHNPPSSIPPQSQERRDLPQQSLIQIREPSHSIRDQMPMTSREQMSHSSRESYRHMERSEMQQSQHQQSVRESMHRERSDHHSQSSQKMRDHHHHMQSQREREHDIRSVRGQIPNFPQRIIHEAHHPIDQRLIQVPSFREQPTSTQANITSHSSSRGHSQQDQSHEVQQSSRSRGNDSSTLTAASLIDAIITHQINQSADPQTTSAPSGNMNAPQPQVTRPGDRLFQSFHRECNESNGKVSPMKSNIYSSKEESSSKQQSGASQQSQSLPPQSHSTQQQPSQQSQGQQPSSQQSQAQSQQSQAQSSQQQSQQQSQHPPLHVVSTSVHVHPSGIPSSEHMDMYNSSPSQGMRSVLYHGFDPQTWKLRRALQPKDVEQNHPAAISYAEPPVPLSPLDYVKNRIAEVMRTSEEEGASSKGNESPAPSEINADDTNEPSIITTTSFIAPSHTYTYPFSALSLSAGATAGVPPPLPPPKVSKQTISESMPEPAPLLSAQYDPLSDED